jgi:hypothetical protein
LRHDNRMGAAGSPATWSHPDSSERVTNILRKQNIFKWGARKIEFPSVDVHEHGDFTLHFLPEFSATNSGRFTPSHWTPSSLHSDPKTQQLSACAATCNVSDQNHYLCSRSVFGMKFINPKDAGRIKYSVSSHWKTEKKFVCFGPQTGYRTQQVTRRPCLYPFGTGVLHLNFSTFCM